LCTPPNKNGKVHPAILYAAKVTGVHTVVAAGGVQAIAAMTYGTASVPKVYKIFGPGNQYVTAAKQAASTQGVAIDMPAGPSEVLIIADSTANPAFVAADMLAQTEHGVDSQAILLTTSVELAQQVQQEVETQLAVLARQALAKQALDNSRIVVLDTWQQMIDFSNQYAPEHLVINVQNTDEVVRQITNAGSVFVGQYTPVSAGDYASGTNHTLPTNGYAKMFSGVNLDSFRKKITLQTITQQGLLTLAPIVTTMATCECLDAHAYAVQVRLKNVSGT
jgi:histidinol dehydrogenase